MKRLFIIGATGHIGGAILSAVATRFPDVKVVALVREHQKAAKLQQRFQSIHTRIGSLTDVKIVECESRSADVVINASPDGLPESIGAIKAALEGLKARTERGFYIQTSGAYIIGEEVGGLKPSDKIWSDITDIENIVNMPLDRYHSTTNRIVRQASSGVNVAIVAPTVVYGLSPSIERRVPITIRDIINTAKELSMGFTMSQGRNIIGYVHVEDLADIFVRLLADAVNCPTSTLQLWGPQAYYFASSEEHTFSAYMRALVEILKNRGAIATDVVKEVDPAGDVPGLEIVKEISETHAFGANVRCRSDRAASLLGWVPRKPLLLETLPEIVDVSL